MGPVYLHYPVQYVLPTQSWRASEKNTLSSTDRHPSLWAEDPADSDIPQHAPGRPWIYLQHKQTNHHHNHHFTALFPGPPGWASARRELLDFMVQGKINRGRHTDHPAWRHSIRTNQCPLHQPPHFLHSGCPSCRPTNSVKASEYTCNMNKLNSPTPVVVPVEQLVGRVSACPENNLCIKWPLNLDIWHAVSTLDTI